MDTVQSRLKNMSDAEFLDLVDLVIQSQADRRRSTCIQMKCGLEYLKYGTPIPSFVYRSFSEKATESLFREAKILHYLYHELWDRVETIRN